MQIARVRRFSLFGAMLFLLNLLTSNVIYHNICILSTLILKKLMYLKSIDELPTPFPLSAFITFHSLSLPSVAFHYLLSPLLFHTSVFHAPLSAPLCFASLCFTPSIVLHRFALLSTIVYPPFALLSPIVYTPFALFTPIVLHPFFYSPTTSANPSPTPQKATFFSFFKEILQKPLTKRKKVIY